NPGDPAALRREPSLSDPQWQQRIRDRLRATVRAHRRDRPLFYDLGDETGIADLAAYWDFDFSESSVSGFRHWLTRQYPSIAALNREWGSSFAGWDDIVPMTTAEAMRRTDSNFSPWAEFKAWMDTEFARSLRRGTAAVHAADRDAVAAIEGAQIPGWGGYDYAKLATAVDAMEIYDAGDNVDIVHSLNPDLILLTTSGRSDAVETHRIWRALLRGARGLILWDDKNELVAADGALGQRASATARQFRELRSGIAAAVINASARRDAVAILYSPASMRTQWMLDWQPKGDAWSRLDAAAQYEDNSSRSAVSDFQRAIERFGLQPRFVTAELIAAGELARRGIRVLVLPHAIALSPGAARGIRRFVESGGTVIADREPALFDNHSRRLPQPLLHDLFPGAPTSVSRGKGSAILLAAPEAEASSTATSLRSAIAAAGVRPSFRLTTPAGEPVTDVEAHRYRNGAVTVIALQRAMEAAGTGRERVVLTLPGARDILDMRAAKRLGRMSGIELDLDPIEPTILTVSPSELPAPVISSPERLWTGETATLRLGLTAPSPAARTVLHVEVADPAGRILAARTRNVVTRGGTASYRFALSADDEVGSWTVRVVDVLGGAAASSTITVSADRPK
ncbi:MAG: hypothetical protein JWL84_3292, partial [Rhodospirillales bacterium]|nr:hypothetical protein [Rhodospirillales bacterium]